MTETPPNGTAGVPDRLRKAAALFEERNAAYGGNYLEFGRVMNALFPEGLGPQPMNENEYHRLMLVVHLVTKLTRYCNSLRRGGHADSLEDLAVYAIMTAETDELAAEDKRKEDEVDRILGSTVRSSSGSICRVDPANPPAPASHRGEPAQAEPFPLDRQSAAFRVGRLSAEPAAQTDLPRHPPLPPKAPG